MFRFLEVWGLGECFLSVKLVVRVYTRIRGESPETERVCTSPAESEGFFFYFYVSVSASSEFGILLHGSPSSLCGVMLATTMYGYTNRFGVTSIEFRFRDLGTRRVHRHWVRCRV